MIEHFTIFIEDFLKKKKLFFFLTLLTPLQIYMADVFPIPLSAVTEPSSKLVRMGRSKFSPDKQRDEMLSFKRF